MSSDCNVYNLCFTSPVIEIIQIRWIIKDFGQLRIEVGSYVKSTVFSSKENPNLKWHLKFYPRNNSRESMEYCSLFLYLENSVVNVNTSALISFKLLNKENRECHHKSLKHEFDKRRDAGLPRYIRLRDILDKGILNNDTLTIGCCIYVQADKLIDLSPPLNSDDGKNTSLKRTHSGQIKTKVSNYNNFNAETFCDLKLILNGETFNVHKTVLCFASPVFEEMLANSTLQNVSIDISDVSPKAMKEMLRYIYTRKTENIPELAGELVAIAYKYDIKDLKRECEEHLCDSLTPDNLLDFLMMAELYDLSQLYTKVSNLFVTHKVEIISTAKFINLQTSNPSIILKLFVSLVSNKKIT